MVGIKSSDTQMLAGWPMSSKSCARSKQIAFLYHLTDLKTKSSGPDERISTSQITGPSTIRPSYIYRRATGTVMARTVS